MLLNILLTKMKRCYTKGFCFTKTLSWHLREKNQEVTSLKSQLEQSVDRYRSELNRLEQTLNCSRKEMDEVRSELQTVSDERLSYQTKVTELRTALKATMKQNEVGVFVTF